MNAPSPTPIYHVTQAANLPGVLAAGGLVSCADLRRVKVSYHDVANQGIQDLRAHTPVLLGAGGTLHDYVPFFFAPKSPMLYFIGKNPGRYPEGQRGMVHLRLTAQSAVRACRQCVFTDGHAIMGLTEFFDDLRHLDRVDWEVMRSKMWTDTQDHPGRKRKRQAEFLIYRRLPWGLVEEIGVLDSRVQTAVLEQLESADHKPTVRVRRDWFY